MKPEPLKDKLKSRHLYEPDEDVVCYDELDIIKAVEWLKERLIEEGIHQRKPISVITFNNILNKAFEDVTKNGREKRT